ncbi:MAG: hypothetical protein WAZ14_03920 [Patescibacteria group bacterium]
MSGVLGYEGDLRNLNTGERFAFVTKEGSAAFGSVLMDEDRPVPLGTWFGEAHMTHFWRREVDSSALQPVVVGLTTRPPAHSKRKPDVRSLVTEWFDVVRVENYRQVIWQEFLSKLQPQDRELLQTPPTEFRHISALASTWSQPFPALGQSIRLTAPGHAAVQLVVVGVRIESGMLTFQFARGHAFAGHADVAAITRHVSTTKNQWTVPYHDYYMTPVIAAVSNPAR